MAAVPPSAKIDKLFMQLIIRAAKGDKVELYAAPDVLARASIHVLEL